MHILSSVTDSAPFRYPDEDIVIGWGQEGGMAVNVTTRDVSVISYVFLL